MPKSKLLTLTDVSPAEKTISSPNSKNVIISNRPTIKDSILKDDSSKDETSSLNHKVVIQPISVNTEQPAPLEEIRPEKDSLTEEIIQKPIISVDQIKSENETEEQPVNPVLPVISNQSKDDDTNINQDNAEQNKIDQELALNKKYDELVETKKYFLPINALQKKKTKRFLILGIIFIIILTIIWIDISLDAGIFHLAGIKPVTHFFQQHP